MHSYTVCAKLALSWFLFIEKAYVTVEKVYLGREIESIRGKSEITDRITDGICGWKLRIELRMEFADGICG